MVTSDEAIRLEFRPQLFMLRVKPELGSSLDQLRNWRPPFVARIGDLWEHHFFKLPPSGCSSSEPIIGDLEAPLSVIRPGELMAIPPSFDPASKENMGLALYSI